jgi:hypothetical protein
LGKKYLKVLECGKYDDEYFGLFYISICIYVLIEFTSEVKKKKLS